MDMGKTAEKIGPGDGTQGGSLHISSAKSIPKCTAMIGLHPAGGPFSTRLSCENHFQEEKTIITAWDDRALRDMSKR